MGIYISYTGPIMNNITEDENDIKSVHITIKIYYPNHKMKTQNNQTQLGHARSNIITRVSKIL